MRLWLGYRQNAPLIDIDAGNPAGEQNTMDLIPHPVQRLMHEFKSGHWLAAFHGCIDG
jgi:hypothetical protein